MPTYDYLCDGCGHGFEEFQSITAKPLRKCPECNRLKLRRLIGGGAGLLFKGAGFYETDYRSADYRKAAAADGQPAEDGKAKNDAKPAEGGSCGRCGDPAGPGACQGKEGT